MDYRLTTPVDPRVAHCIHHYMVTKFGNASSVDHAWGDRADIEVKQAAQHVAALTGAIPQDIIWTSGSTESINLAIQGTIHQLTRSGITPRIAVTTVEHKAVRCCIIRG
nr:aminotransferase class V-fold PLP-dependent enzyme [Leptolyngbya sp. CCY15150]